SQAKLLVLAGGDQLIGVRIQILERRRPALSIRPNALGLPCRRWKAQRLAVAVVSLRRSRRRHVRVRDAEIAVVAVAALVGTEIGIGRLIWILVGRKVGSSVRPLDQSIGLK